MNEARLTFGKRAKKDLLVKLREQQQQFDELVQKARAKMRIRSIHGRQRRVVVMWQMRRLLSQRISENLGFGESAD